MAEDRLLLSRSGVSIYTVMNCDKDRPSTRALCLIQFQKASSNDTLVL